MGKIDFTSHIPYYLQLIDLIKANTSSGVWKRGEQIPGEMDLCSEYEVSRTVVRQALHELELEGAVYRRKGIGTFISEPKINEGLVQRLTGFHQDMVARGFKPGTQVLVNHIVQASDKIAGLLEIPAGSDVVELKRLRFVNDVPIQIVTSYLPCPLCASVAEVDLTNISLYEFLERECKLVIVRGRRFIEAVSANAEEAWLLDVNPGSPLIMLDSVGYLENEIPLEYFHALYRGDRSRFEVELVRVREATGQVSPLDGNLANLPHSNVIIQEKPNP